MRIFLASLVSSYRSIQLLLSLFLSPVLIAHFTCYRNLSLFFSIVCSIRVYYCLIAICLRNIIDYDSRALFVSDHESRFPQLLIREEGCQILLSCYLYENSIAIDPDLQFLHFNDTIFNIATFMSNYDIRIMITIFRSHFVFIITALDLCIPHM